MSAMQPSEDTTTVHTTECAYEVDATWSDHTRYVYQQGELRVLVEPFAPRATALADLDQALDRFRRTISKYELVDRYDVDRPVPGSLVVSHRLGGLSRFETSVLFPVGDQMWTCRISAPLEEEERCDDVLESFLSTYQPIEEA